MTIIATPNSKEANYLISLEDADGTKIGFIPTDAGGKENISVVKRFPLVRTGLKTATGSTKYSDFEEPYMSIPQDDWTGGRGAEDLDDDATKFYDSCSVDTSSEVGVILAGLPTYTTGYRSQDFNMPGDVVWKALYDTSQYRSRSFVAGSTYNAVRLELIIRKVGNPGQLTVSLNTSRSSSAVLVSKTINPEDIEALISTHHPAAFSSSTPLTSGTTYYVVVGGISTDDASNHWEIASDRDAYDSFGSSCHRSADYSAWIQTDEGFYFRVTAANVPFISRYFEYKRQLYFLRMNDNGNVSRIYINGDRGAADDNSAWLAKLNDATKSWTVDEWEGCIVMITQGPGADENINWRTITANDATSLTVDENWEVTHTTSTEYVILGSNKWTSHFTCAEFATDVAVADEFVYIAFGDNSTNNILRYQEYNLSGVWTQRTASDVVKAHRLLAIRDPSRGQLLFGSRNNHAFYGVCVWKARVPEAWGDLYTIIGTLAPTNEPWDSWNVTNATQTIDQTTTKIAIGASFTTGVAAVENLDAPIDISQGTRLGTLVKSDVTAGAAGLKLVYDDSIDLGHYLVATSIKKRTSAPAWSTLTNAFDGSTDTTEDLDWTTTDEIYIFSTVKFSEIVFDMGSTVNDIASVMSGAGWNGWTWTSVTLTDGTVTSGKTLAKDGSITFTPIHDWDQCTLDSVTGYAIKLMVSVNLTASIDINEVQVARKNNQYLSLPALTANQWAWATMSYAPTEEPNPDETTIKSIGLYVNTDLGAQNVWLRGGVIVLNETVEYEKLPTDARITNLVAYTHAETEQEIAWAITENYFYKLDDGEGNLVATPVPLKEMAGLRSEINGLGAAVNDVYLYFNLGENLERYFNRNLDDVGPNKGAGLPIGRQGAPVSLISYPGRLLAGIDVTGGNSSVLLFIDNNWHEVFRAPYAGRLRSIYVQSLPGDERRLWITWNANVVWVPISISPYYDENYKYMYEGHLTSAWLYGGMQDIIKMWNSVKLFLENVDATRYIKADYQVDNADNAWTEIDGTFDSMPSEEILVSQAKPPNVTGRRFRYRLRFYTQDSTETPRLKAVVVQAIGGVPLKYGYVWTFEMADGAMAMDREAGRGTTFPSGVEFSLQIDTWTRNVVPLYMRTRSIVYDDHVVKIDPMGLQWLSLDENVDVGQGREKHYAQLTVLEL